MDVLDYIRSITGKRSLQYAIYTMYDENYSLWNLGYSLGEILNTVNISETNATVDGNAIEETKKAVLLFKLSYNKIKTQSKALNEKNTFIDNCISDLVTRVENMKGDSSSIYLSIDNLKKSIIHDIKSFSTHLTNIFLMGFELKQLHVNLIHKPFNELIIRAGINKLLSLLTYFEEGDKKLESPNLEISELNIKILKTLLKLLNRRIKKIFERSKDMYTEYKQLINEIFFKMLTDIILDIKNPIQLIKGKFFLFLAYYYMFILILILLELLYHSNWIQNLIETDIVLKISEEIKPIQLILFFLPLVFYVFVFLFKKCNHFLIKLFIKVKMNRQINKFCKAKCQIIKIIEQ